MKKIKLHLPADKKIYFASDFHLGIPNHKDSLARELKIVAWMNSIKPTASELYLVGDLFDFWFEYKHVVPRGFVRLLAKIAEFVDDGIKVTVFTGNHDMWMFNYLEEELGVHLFREPVTLLHQNQQIFIGHGDGLGPGDNGYKFIKKVFANSLCQWLFARIHPNLGITIANFWSGKSRSVNHYVDREYNGPEKEMLVHFCRSYLAKNPSIDYFIFGHRHLPLEIDISENSRYVNLGDWITYFTYAEYDGTEVLLKKL